MSCSKLDRKFPDAKVERLMKRLDRAKFSGDELTQQVKRLKQKILAWIDCIGAVCKRVTALADKIDSDHKMANVVKVAGSSASVVAAPVSVGAFVALTFGYLTAPVTAGASLSVGAAIALASGGVASAGAVAAGSAMIVDDKRQRSNKKKALELLEEEKELREDIAERMFDVQRASKKFEDSINLIREIAGFEHSHSLGSIEETSTFLQSLLDDLGIEEDHEMTFNDVVKALSNVLPDSETLQNLQKLLQFLSSCSKVVGIIGAVIAAASFPLSIITLVISATDLYHGSKTELAERLREHVKLLKRDRAKLREAVQSFYS